MFPCGDRGCRGARPHLIFCLPSGHPEVIFLVLFHPTTAPGRLSTSISKATMVPAAPTFLLGTE